MSDTPVDVTIIAPTADPAKGDSVSAAGMGRAVASRTAASKLPYVVGLDGLRAVAVVAVLLYHGDVGWMPGGFLGVEVFFVISGYLITSLLLLAWLDGKLNLREFWIRRARRLLPALFLLLGGVWLSALVLARDALDRLGGDVVASVAYVNNWYQIAQEESYFEVFGRPPLLRHLWSLSVEEQFYLLWPVILVAGLVLLGAARSKERAAGRMFYAVAGLAACSAVLMWALFVPFGDPSRIYYGTDTRASALLIGTAAAFVWRLDRPRNHLGGWSRRALHAGGIAGLAILLLSMVAVSEYGAFLYRGGFLLVSLGTTLVIVAATHPKLGISRLLSLPMLRWVGTRSYGIYLWHWPVFAMTRPHVDIALSGPSLFALRMALTATLAELSFRYVEVPIRRDGLAAWVSSITNRMGFLGTRPRVAFGAVLAVLLLAAGAGVHLTADSETTALATGVGVAARPGSADPELDAVGPGDDRAPPSASVGAGLAPTTEAPKKPVPDGGPAEIGTAPATQPPSDVSGDGHEKPSTAVAPPAPQPRVLLVGDSVMLGAERQLEAAFSPGLLLDAEQSRQITDAHEVAGPVLEGGTEGLTVVLHLGTNGVFSPDAFDALMGGLAGVDRVFFINVRVPRRWESPVNAALEAGVARWENAELIDWHAHSSEHRGWFAGDEVHLTASGAEAYAALISDAIGWPPAASTEALEPQFEAGSRL